MNRSQKFYLTAIISFGVIVAVVFGVEIWAFILNSGNQTTVTESEYRIEKLTEQANIQEEIKTDYQKALKYLPYVNTALPEEKDSSALVSDLNSLANQSSLTLTLVQSNNYTKQQNSSKDQSLLQTVKGKYSYEMPLQIEVLGPYNGFITFVKRLENYQRLVNISSIDMEKSQDKSAPADQIDVKINLTAYLKK